MDFSAAAETYRRDGIVQISARNCPLVTAIQILQLSAEATDLSNPTSVATYENIFVLKKGDMLSEESSLDVVEKRKVPTRFENFISTNKSWSKLCGTGGVLSRLVGEVCCDEETIGDGKNEPWCLYKEKLNIKPAGSSGFAPHLDSPSLRVTGLCDTFVTVMIAIDDMTIENGCLQVCRGNWTEENSVLYENIDETADLNNPDGNGRRGAIQPEIASRLHWEPIECQTGDVFVFSGWLPHRSAPNTTQFPRRAVFLTYNPSEDGELSDIYYRIMRDKRATYLKQFIAEQQQTATTTAAAKAATSTANAPQNEPAVSTVLV